LAAKKQEFDKALRLIREEVALDYEDSEEEFDHGRNIITDQTISKRDFQAKCESLKREIDQLMGEAQRRIDSARETTVKDL